MYLLLIRWAVHLSWCHRVWTASRWSRCWTSIVDWHRKRGYGPWAAHRWPCQRCKSRLSSSARTFRSFRGPGMRRSRKTSSCSRFTCSLSPDRSLWVSHGLLSPGLCFPAWGLCIWYSDCGFLRLPKESPPCKTELGLQGVFKKTQFFIK